MSVGAPVLRFGMPLLGRLWMVGFSLVWLGVLVSFVVRGVRDSGPNVAGIALPVAMAVFAGTLAVRMLRSGATAYADELVVRNIWRTRRIPRGEVEDIRVGDLPAGQFGQALHVLTRGGSVFPVDTVTAVLPGGRARLAAERDQLRQWREGSR